MTATHTRRFLVADDDPDMLALIATVLRRTGAQVVEAHCGTDLLNLATDAGENPEDNHFDAIFSDIQMPDITVIDVMERLPVLTRHTPVILFTGVRDRPLREKAYDLGVQAIIDKPLNPMDLIALMRFLTTRFGKEDANGHHYH